MPKKYLRSMDIAYVNKNFFKCIPLIKTERLKCYEFIKELKMNKKFKMSDFIDIYGDFDCESFVFYEKNLFILEQTPLLKEIMPKLLNKESTIFNIFKLLFVYEYHMQDTMLSKLYLNFKKASKA